MIRWAEVYSFPNMESQNHRMCTWRRKWSTKSEELTRRVQQGLWPGDSHHAGHPAPYIRAMGRGAQEGVALAQHPELLISPKLRLKPKPRVLLRCAHCGCAQRSPEHNVRMDAVMVHEVPSVWVCSVAALGLQSLDTHGGAMSCFNPQLGPLCHTAAHSLLGGGEDWRAKGEKTCGST